MTATLEQDLGRKIQTEEDAIAQKGKENIDLLAEKHTLLEVWCYFLLFIISHKAKTVSFSVISN